MLFLVLLLVSKFNLFKLYKFYKFKFSKYPWQLKDMDKYGNQINKQENGRIGKFLLRFHETLNIIFLSTSLYPLLAGKKSVQ